MSLPRNVDREIAAARRGEMIGAHFGIVCSSWSVLNRLLNGGTRTCLCPLGDNSLVREILGNKQAKQLFRLLDVFDQLGIPWSVENPESSALWWLPQWHSVAHVTFDQCMLGLRPPEPGLARTHRVQKKTRLVGTVSSLVESFNMCKCDRQHSHSHAMGSCKVNGKGISRAKAAGAYPQ